MKPQILLIELTGQSCEIFSNALSDSGYQTFFCLQEPKGLLNYTRKFTIDFLVVNVHSPDRLLLKELTLALRDNPLPVVMFAKTSNKTLTTEVAKAGISAFIVDGFKPARLKHILDLAQARFVELESMKKELHQAKAQLTERKTVEKAKGILMKRRAIDEETAFHMIRKMAVDRHQKISDVAQNIISVDTLLM